MAYVIPSLQHPGRPAPAGPLPTRAALIDLRDDVLYSDDLAPVRGIMLGVLFSAPVWAGVGTLVWRALH